MKIRSITELVILAAFLISALVVATGFNTGDSIESELSKSVRGYVQEGNRLFNAGRVNYNKASIQYWKAIKLDPDNAEAHYKLASIYYAYVWNHEALEALSEVKRVEPSYKGLYLLLGKVHDKMANAEEAFAAFQKAVEQQPQNSEAHYYLGTMYQQQSMSYLNKDEDEKAVDVLNMSINEYVKAIEANSDDTAVVKSHLQLGRIYRNNQPDIAAQKLRKALDINPQAMEVISELRNIYRIQAENYESQREFLKAAEKYREMININPGDERNADIYVKIGNIYRSNELYDRAAKVFEKAAELDPMNFEAFTALKELELLKDTEE
ncbi:tetratricopeptide repeat protein [Candidatus Poribacteria bacterium]|nr:tetratricopeptide repeat protein [Candidatus Poribacteria bacterium]